MVAVRLSVFWTGGVGHLLSEHHRAAWTRPDVQDLCGIPLTTLPGIANHEPVLSALSTCYRLASAFLLCKVSFLLIARHRQVLSITSHDTSLKRLGVGIGPLRVTVTNTTCFYRFIDGAYRPPIWVRVLPALENIFYGANLSNILSSHKMAVLDVLAWLPYGITHFGAPVVCSMIMFVWGPPNTVPTFARAFGYMNIAGVVIQILFPCSPPWYENMYGLVPADYSIPGSPAGLARVDKLFGINLYTSTFTQSPLVFGAFPSLHSGNATIEALFMSFVFPKLTPLFFLYTCWLWWSTMYLSHHYAIDLVGGSMRKFVPTFDRKHSLTITSRWNSFLHRQIQIPTPNSAGQRISLGLRLCRTRRISRLILLRHRPRWSLRRISPHKLRRRVDSCIRVQHFKQKP